MIGGTFTPDLSGMEELPATLTVVLNGTEATLPLDHEHSGSGFFYYGEFDGSTFVFTTYPCAVELYQPGSPSVLIVPEAGTYSLTIYAPW